VSLLAFLLFMVLLLDENEHFFTTFLAFLIFAGSGACHA
jgi:hypothetical protein